MRLSSKRKVRSVFADKSNLVSRVTYADQIYAELCRSLTSGELAPGDRLSIRKIAENLGVSMMPVREAITRLAVDGALEILPTKAVRVPVMTSAVFHELTTVRIRIEGFAAEQAAVRRSDVQLAAIKRYDAEFREAISRNQPNNEEALLANRNLHFAVYQASGFPTLVRITEMLWLRVGPIINLDLKSSVAWRAKAALDHHAQLVQAIETGNGSQAAKALEADLLGTARFVIEAGYFHD